jgi:hypothetical protein
MKPTPYTDEPPIIDGKQMPAFSPIVRRAVAGLAGEGANNATFVAAYIAIGLTGRKLVTAKDAEQAMNVAAAEEYDAAEAYILRVIDRESEAQVEIPEGKQED